MRMAIDVTDPGAGAAVIAEVRNQHREDHVLFGSKYEPNIDLSELGMLDGRVTDWPVAGRSAVAALAD